ncbi:MAG: hypothetical protein Q4C25_09610, partial [Bacillota bacterium]|nr:hypothetical protein [Bacillota bacterium]
KYYCPMDPERKLEHIIVPSLDLAVICSNDYHSALAWEIPAKSTVIEVFAQVEGKEEDVELLLALQKESRADLERALFHLKKAKEYHDKLEECYIPHMDFDAIEKEKHKIIDKIEAMVL